MDLKNIMLSKENPDMQKSTYYLFLYIWSLRIGKSTDTAR
jgi:hypothetical protein